MPWTAYIDGGARGNPGPAAAGVHIRNDSGQVVFSGGLFLGHKTNNEAEYAGLLHALDLLQAAGATDAIIHSDSELLVRQMQGKYRVKAPNLKPLFDRAAARAGRFNHCAFQHVPRERNREADGLANQAMDAVAHVIEVDTLHLASQMQGPAPAPTPTSTAVPSAGKVRSHGGQSTSAHVPGTAPATRGAVMLAVVKPPKSGGCPAGMRAAQVFAFSQVVPAGLCVEACAEVIEAVRSMRSVLEDGSGPLEPMMVTCQRPECGAVFQLSAGR